MENVGGVAINIVDLPDHILEKILLLTGHCSALLQYELVCSAFCRLIRNHVWKKVRVLTKRIAIEEIGVGGGVRRQAATTTLSTAASIIKLNHLSDDKLDKIIARTSNNLTELDLGEVPRWKHLLVLYPISSSSSAAIQTMLLSIQMPKLQKLDLSGVPLNDGKFLQAIAAQFSPSLQYLVLRGCFDLKDHGPSDDPYNVYRNDGQISQEQLCHFLAHCGHLKHLDISGNGIRPFVGHSFHGLFGAVQLVHFDAVGTWLGGHQMLALVHQTKQTLRSLHFALVTNPGVDASISISPTQLDAILQCADNLDELKIVVLGAPEEYSLNLPLNLRHSLQSLTVINAGDMLMPIFQRGGGGGTFPKLRRLHLNYANFSEHPLSSELPPPLDVSSAFVKIFPKLAHLSLIYCKDVTDLMLRNVAEIREMIELRVVKCQYVTDKGFKHFLEHCNNIQLFEGDQEQMSNDLMEAVQCTMGKRVAAKRGAAQKARDDDGKEEGEWTVGGVEGNDDDDDDDVHHFHFLTNMYYEDDFEGCKKAEVADLEKFKLIAFDEDEPCKFCSFYKFNRF